jgi:hypothetical protein
MDPLDTMKAMSELWGQGVQSFLSAQRSAFGAMAPFAGEASIASMMPDAQAFESARQAYVEAWTSAQAISAALAKGLRTIEGQGTDPMTTGILTKIFDPKGWLSATSEVDEALNRMAEGPRLADLWNVERKFAAVYAAWLELRRCNLEHNTIMLQTWTKATEVFAKALRARPETGQPVESGRELIALWVETANDVLLETQRSEPFLKSQRETLKASTDLRLAQRSVAEFFAEMFGYPTRAELDDVHKSITELRREVRAERRRRAAVTGTKGGST